MIPWQAGCVLLLAGLSAVQPAGATTETDVNGSFRGSYFSSSRDLTDHDHIASGSAWLRVDSRFGSRSSLTAEAWTRHDRGTGSASSQAIVREAYVSTSLGHFNLCAGKQIVAWGRADKLNPTDNLSPRDFTLLTPEDNEQRFGSRGVQVRYDPPGSEVSLIGVWQPRISPNKVPLPRLAGISYSTAVPDTKQFALKLERSGSDIDWSLSYLRGVDLNPDLELRGATMQGIDILLRHNPVRILGMDAATVIGRYGLRAELAYTWTDYSAANPWAKKPFLYLVVGGDRTFDNDVNINLQYFYYRVTGYTDPRGGIDTMARSVALQGAVASHQSEREKHGFSLRVGKNWLNGALEGEIAAIGSFTGSDFAIKPKLIYAVNDQVKVSLGAEVFRGEAESFFGRLQDASNVFAELKFSF